VIASPCELRPCRKWNVQHAQVFGLLQPLPGDIRSNDVTSGHLRSPDVIYCHVTASHCELRPCRKWNVQYTPVLGLLQPPPGDFRSNDITSGSLPVTWGHLTSFPVTWLPPPANYGLVWSQMYSVCHFSAFYSLFQVTSGQMSLPGHFRSPGSRDVISCHVTASSCELALVGSEGWSIRQFSAFYSHFQVTSGQITSLPVTWGHVMSFPVTWLPPPTSYGLVASEMYSIRQFSAFYSHSQVTSVKWRHFRFTSGHLRSCDVICCHVTASSCEIQPCRKSNVQYTPVFGFYRHFQVTSGQMTSLLGHFRSLRSRDVFSCHVTASSCGLQTCRRSNAQYTPVFGILQPLTGDFRSNDVTSGSLPVTWGRVTSFPVTWLPPPARHSLVGSKMYSIRQF